MIEIQNKEFKLSKSRFSDGTQKLVVNIVERVSQNYKDTITISWRFERESEVLTLYYLVNWFKDHFANPQICLKLYYVPYARMDRVECVEDVFTLKYFTSLINSLEFSRVEILDPHSRVSAALINRAMVFEPVQYIRETLRGIIKEGRTLTVLFPDRGAYERYLSPELRAVFKEFGITQLLYGEKVRDWKTSNIQNFTINTRGLRVIENVLIIDDIITTGGTIEECVKALDDIQATGSIFIYTTFLESGAFQSQKFNWVLDQCEKVFTPAALPLKLSGLSEKINILPLQ